MKDDGQEARDTLSLKSPAVSGSDRDTLTWERVAEVDGGNRTLSESFRYETVRNKEKTILEGEAELENAFDIASSLLTGKAWVEQTLPDETLLTWVMEPNMTFALGSMNPEASGNVLVTYKEDKRVTQEATVYINLAYGDGFNWELREGETNLETLGDGSADGASGAERGTPGGGYASGAAPTASGGFALYQRGSNPRGMATDSGCVGRRAMSEYNAFSMKIKEEFL